MQNAGPPTVRTRRLARSFVRVNSKRNRNTTRTAHAEPRRRGKLAAPLWRPIQPTRRDPQVEGEVDVEIPWQRCIQGVARAGR